MSISSVKDAADKDQDQDKKVAVKVVKLEPNRAEPLAELCGPFDKNLRQIEARIGVKIKNRGHEFEVSGSSKATIATIELLNHLYREAVNGTELNGETLNLFLQESGVDALTQPEEQVFALIKTRKKSIKPRGKNQNE